MIVVFTDCSVCVLGFTGFLCDMLPLPLVSWFYRYRGLCVPLSYSHLVEGFGRVSPWVYSRDCGGRVSRSAECTSPLMR